MDKYELKFPLGSEVIISLEGEIEGFKCSVDKHVYVRAIRLESGCHDTYIEYGLTDDLCGPYHYGKEVRWWKKASEIRNIE